MAGAYGIFDWLVDDADGLLDEAIFWAPQELALDRGGRVYVIDRANTRARIILAAVR